MIFRAELEAFVHPTESVEKVEQALSLFCDVEIERIPAKNHWHSKMWILRSSPDLSAINLSSLFSGWPPEQLETWLDTHLDEDGTLHIRLDKQAAFSGSLKLSDSSDCIKLELHTKHYPKDLEKSREELLQFLS